MTLPFYEFFYKFVMAFSQFFHGVEINENQSNEKNKGYLFRACCSKEVSHHHSCLAETHIQGETWESFIVEKGEGFRYALLGGCWHGEAGGGITRSRVSYVTG